MSKTLKSFAKRIKITRRGKVLRRKSRVSHFLAKQSSDQRRLKRKKGTFPKAILKYLIR